MKWRRVWRCHHLVLFCILNNNESIHDLCNPAALKNAYGCFSLHVSHYCIKSRACTPKKISYCVALAFRLRDWGIKRDDLSWLASHCFTTGRMENNIVDLSMSQVQNILEEIY